MPWKSSDPMEWIKNVSKLSSGNRHRKADICFSRMVGLCQCRRQAATRILPAEEYKAGYYSVDQPSVGEICDIADDSLFRAISANPNHPLHNLLLPKIVRQHDLSKRAHQFQLPTKGNSISDMNFLPRLLFKNSCWPSDDLFKTLSNRTLYIIM